MLDIGKKLKDISSNYYSAVINNIAIRQRKELENLDWLLNFLYGFKFRSDGSLKWETFFDNDSSLSDIACKALKTVPGLRIARLNYTLLDNLDRETEEYSVKRGVLSAFGSDPELLIFSYTQGNRQVILYTDGKALKLDTSNSEGGSVPSLGMPVEKAEDMDYASYSESVKPYILPLFNICFEYFREAEALIKELETENIANKHTLSRLKAEGYFDNVDTDLDMTWDNDLETVMEDLD